MLNVNVAFLAIQSVDVNNGPYHSPAQISSYLSIVANIGSITVGLLLVRQNYIKNEGSGDNLVSRSYYHYDPGLMHGHGSKSS